MLLFHRSEHEDLKFLHICISEIFEMISQLLHLTTKQIKEKKKIINCEHDPQEKDATSPILK